MNIFFKFSQVISPSETFTFSMKVAFQLYEIQMNFFWKIIEKVNVSSL